MTRWRRETFKFWDLVRLKLEVLWYMHLAFQSWPQQACLSQVCRGQWSSVRRPRWQQRLYDSDGGSLEERSFLWHYIRCRGGEGTVRSPYNAAINPLGAKSLWRTYTDIFVVYKISFLDIEISQVCEVHPYEHQQPWRWIEIKSQTSLCFGQIRIH